MVGDAVKDGRLAIPWGIALCLVALVLFVLPILGERVGMWPSELGGLGLALLCWFVALVFLVAGIPVLILGLWRRARR